MWSGQPREGRGDGPSGAQEIEAQRGFCLEPFFEGLSWSLSTLEVVAGSPCCRDEIPCWELQTKPLF